VVKDAIENVDLIPLRHYAIVAAMTNFPLPKKLVIVYTICVLCKRFLIILGDEKDDDVLVSRGNDATTYSVECFIIP